MASCTEYAVIPGSFHFDTVSTPKLDINVGTSRFFQPPRTPSASNSLYRTVTSYSIKDVSSNSNRKRSWRDSFVPDHTSPSSVAPHASIVALDPMDVSSPAPFVNTRYALAGGLDTPTAATSSAMELHEEDDQAFTELHLRGRGHRGFNPASGDYFPPFVSDLRKESNGRARIPAPPPIRDGLGKVFHDVVGVAGRVLEFCKATAFRGFYAGGGQGYQLKPAGRATSDDQNLWLDVDRNDISPCSTQVTGPVPGCFPDEDFIPDYMSQDHITTPRAKKIRRGKGISDISTSWVVVDGNLCGKNSPSRLSHRKVPSTAAAARRPVSKNGRRHILSASRPSLPSYAISPSLRSDRPASFASIRSPVSSPKYERPGSSESQRQAMRLKKREPEEDAQLKRVNQQLKAMIKEGKEALGTKFEVQEEPIPEGFADGDGYIDMEKG